jgi:hypothetical protein
MEHLSQEVELDLKRIGFHYHSDDESFSVSDARQWVKEIKEMGANWLILENPSKRAIPEEFIRYLVKHEINLIVHFAKTIQEYEGLSEIEILVQVYAKWGVKYACLFDQPNMRSHWGDTKWVEEDVVETHAQLFLEFAQLCVRNGIHPILSPLFPGGDYWDLAFFDNTLKYIQHNADSALISNLVIAAYGWHHHHPLEWGAGGREKWPNISPFASKNEAQDHQGFRLYEWYAEISQKYLGRKIPTIIFAAGESGPNKDIDQKKEDDCAISYDQVIHLLCGENAYDVENPDHLLSPIGLEVIACCFSASLKPGSNVSSSIISGSSQSAKINNHEMNSPSFSEKSIEGSDSYPYSRYIYIDHPLKHRTHAILESLDRYIKSHKPYVGFSLIEGCKSAYLVVITDDKETFSDEYRAFLAEANIVKVISLSELSTLNI